MGELRSPREGIESQREDLERLKARHSVLVGDLPLQQERHGRSAWLAGPITNLRISMAEEWERRFKHTSPSHQPASPAPSPQASESASGEDRAPVTVYVIAKPHEAISVSGRSSSPSVATFVDNAIVVIGDDNKIRLNSEYRIDRIEADATRMMESLSLQAKGALEKLIADPEDMAANGRFRRNLQADRRLPVPSTEQHHSVLQDPAQINTIDCNIVAIGDRQRHNLTSKQRVTKASLDIAAVMKDSPELASALARQLASTGKGYVGRELDDALTKALTVEHLSSGVLTVPRRSPRVVKRLGSMTAIDASLSVVGSRARIDQRPVYMTVKRVETAPLSASIASKYPPLADKSAVRAEPSRNDSRRRRVSKQQLTQRQRV